MNEARNNVIEILANIKSCPSIKPPSITDNITTWLKGFIFIQNPTQEQAMIYNEVGIIQFIDQTQICLGLLTYYEDETPKWNIRWKYCNSKGRGVNPSTFLLSSTQFENCILSCHSIWS